MDKQKLLVKQHLISQIMQILKLLFIKFLNY